GLGGVGQPLTLQFASAGATVVGPDIDENKVKQLNRGDFHYKFLGRRDRMIKKRGYQMEFGEIEVALYRHPAIKEAAVLAFPDEENVPIKAFASTRNGTKLSIIELKKFCSENLPLYMVPDLFCCLESLPKTSTDKIDYQKLKVMK